MNKALAVTLGLVLMASGACGDDDAGSAAGRGDDSGATTSSVPESSDLPEGWQVIDAVTAPQLTVESERLWGGGQDGPLLRVESATFLDDTLVLRGGNDDSGLNNTHLAVVDAASGEARWSLEELDELPGGDGAQLRWPSAESDQLAADRLAIVEHGDSWMIAVPYWIDLPGGLETHGLAALSAETGEVVWSTPLIEEQSINEEALLYWLVATDGAVVTKVEAYDEAQPGHLMALDPSDGTILWEQESEGTLRAGIGDTLLVERENEGETDAPSDLTVVGLDATTGTMSWNLSDRHLWSELQFVSGDKALVMVPPGAGAAPDEVPELLVLEAGTGEEVASFGSKARNCVGARQSPIACPIWTGAAAALATFNPEDGSTGVSHQPLPEDEGLLGSYGDHVIVGNVEEGDYHIVDRAGAVVGEAPGSPLAMSADYGLFVDKASGTFTVHEITLG